MNEKVARQYVAVIGAGPSGLFAARELVGKGFGVALLNRDIKPGGLAEYGIYPTKTRMKEGLRNQFRQILALEDLAYFGNVLVGTNGDLSLDALRDMGFHALLVAVGAQSAKRLGIPGEDLTGVYHAKDVVYHYNVLPPFSETTYQIGKRVAVIGAGNVMMDITHWLIEEQNVERVIAVARRGPGEVKFDRKELEGLVGYIDLEDLDQELERVEPIMREVLQDPNDFRTMIADTLKKAGPVNRDACFSLRFLSSPARILEGERGQVAGLQVEKNILALGDDGECRAKGTGEFERIDVDTVIFAIGDIVDGALGLPLERGEFVKSTNPRFPLEGISYESFDPITGQEIPDLFLTGWARRPSVGLVGVARKDAINAVQAATQYLQTVPSTTEPVIDRLRDALSKVGHPVVEKHDLMRLQALEQEKARAMGLPEYKFNTNQAMLEVLGLVSSRET